MVKIVSAQLETPEKDHEQSVKSAHPLVSLFVPGAVLFRHVATHLNDLGVLNHFYYSHAWKTTPASLGLPNDKATNLWVKEHLLRAHIRTVGWRFTDTCIPLYNRIWDQQLLNRWRPAPVAHGLLWGASMRTLAHARRNGSVTLGLVVNAHPEVSTALLAEEGERVGVRQSAKVDSVQRAILDEKDICEHLHAESHFTRDSFIAKGFPADRVHLVPPSQNTKLFYPATEGELRQKSQEFRVICVAQISLRKGQVHLLKAWRKMKLKNAKLTLVGEVNYQIAPLIKPYADEFEHIVRVPNTKLRENLIGSSIFVLPSIEDGYSFVVGEALSCGIPVITTSNNGAADLIIDGKNGYVVPASDPDALVERLQRLYENPDLLQALSVGAISQEGIGTWKQRALDYTDVYRRIAPG
jgi:glycosyltransferase involved in cell wall biosynthesis